MLIRNAKDSAGKAIEVWLRDGKIAAVGLGLLVPEGEEVLDAKGRTVLPAFIDTATGAPRALSTRRTSPPAPPRLPRAGTPSST
ncbi:MAG TPA: hypothetical protein PKX81_04645 [Gemmiger formicilis]|nr:hypothetical protein [Gemmiger formicilis]